MIPIKIRPAFWIFAALIAFILSGGDFLQMVIWVGIIFVSVLFHEFGHALTALAFGQKPRIELVAMGGLTYHDGEKLRLWKRFLITLNGPVFGFLLALGALFLGRLPSLQGGITSRLLTNTYGVNIIWTIVNLLPVLPLDGGQLMRIVFEKIFRVKGFRYALGVSSFIAVAISLFLFVTDNFLVAALFFLFAFENFTTFRKMKSLRASDSNDRLKVALNEAEMLLFQGDKELALQAFEALRQEAKEGMIYIAASQYLAFLDYEVGKKKEAYSMLLSLREKLDPQSLCLLHKLAFEQDDFSVVIELAGPVFQYMPEAEVALRSAYASGALGQVDPTIGWLQAAVQCGVQNLREIIQEKNFDPIRTSPAFQVFLDAIP